MLHCLAPSKLEFAISANVDSEASRQEAPEMIGNLPASLLPAVKA